MANSIQQINNALETLSFGASISKGQTLNKVCAHSKGRVNPGLTSPIKNSKFYSDWMGESIWKNFEYKELTLKEFLCLIAIEGHGFSGHYENNQRSETNFKGGQVIAFDIDNSDEKNIVETETGILVEEPTKTVTVFDFLESCFANDISFVLPSSSNYQCVIPDPNKSGAKGKTARQRFHVGFILPDYLEKEEFLRVSNGLASLINSELGFKAIDCKSDESRLLYGEVKAEWHGDLVRGSALAEKLRVFRAFPDQVETLAFCVGEAADPTCQFDKGFSVCPDYHPEFGCVINETANPGLTISSELLDKAKEEGERLELEAAERAAQKQREIEENKKRFANREIGEVTQVNGTLKGGYKALRLAIDAEMMANPHLVMELAGCCESEPFEATANSEAGVQYAHPLTTTKSIKVFDSGKIKYHGHSLPELKDEKLNVIKFYNYVYYQGFAPKGSEAYRCLKETASQLGYQLEIIEDNKLPEADFYWLGNEDLTTIFNSQDFPGCKVATIKEEEIKLLDSEKILVLDESEFINFAKNLTGDQKVLLLDEIGYLNKAEKLLQSESESVLIKVEDLVEEIHDTLLTLSLVSTAVDTVFTLASQSKFEDKDQRGKNAYAATLAKLAAQLLEPWDQESLAEQLKQEQKITKNSFKSWVKKEEAIGALTQAERDIEFVEKAMKGNLRLNVMTQEIEIKKQGNDRWEPFEVDRSRIYLLRDFKGNGLQLGNQDAKMLFSEIAEGDRFNPVREYLKSNWETHQDLFPTAKAAHDYLDQFIEKYLHTTDPLDRQIYKKTFLLSAVKRANHPGCKKDDLMTLFGGQGAGKTRHLSAMSVNKDWYNENIHISNDKDMLMAAQICWIGEFQELEVLTGKKDAGQVKAFLSTGVDRFRPPYRSGYIMSRRSSIMVASVNTGDFLRDPTGSRRFRVIEVKEEIPSLFTEDENGNSKVMREVVDPVWAAAYKLYLEGETHYLSDVENAASEQRNKKYQKSVPLEDTIALLLEHEAVTTPEVILEELFGLDHMRYLSDQRLNFQITEVLQKLGFAKDYQPKLKFASHVKTITKQPRVWRRKPLAGELSEDYERAMQQGRERIGKYFQHNYLKGAASFVS